MKHVQIVTLWICLFLTYFFDKMSMSFVNLKSTFQCVFLSLIYSIIFLQTARV